MDDSDDYFQDSFELDENVLAALDEAEAKYAQSTSQFPARAPDSLPPHKRQKLSHYDSPEDIPDVFLRPDGTYGVGMYHEDEISVPKSLIAVDQRPTACHVSPSEARSFGVLEERSLMRVSARNVLPERSPAQEQTDIGPIVNISQATSGGRAASVVPSGLEAELASLKSTVEMLKLENHKVKAALQDAETSRFAREGEVTMLRKKVEKAAQEHSDGLIKLKEVKEAASHEQARIQKEMKQQIERLRTEYIFKQHESESSSRRSLLSTRSRRTTAASQMSPVPVPPAMREWSATRPGFSKSNIPIDTPSARRQVFEKQDRGRANTGAKFRASASDMRFPGFENSFLPSSPLNSPSRARQPASGNNRGSATPTKGNNGKRAALGRAKGGILSPVKPPPSLVLKPPTGERFEELQIDDYIQDFDADISVSDGSPRARSKSVGTESSPNFDRGSECVGDVAFSDDVDKDFAAEGCSFEGIDWGEELHYMLFSHVSAVSDTLTFHSLLCADIPDQSYQQSCSAILEALGTKYKFATLQELLELVADKLVSMAVLLRNYERFRHLRALFELLGSTMVYIPSFTRAVLRVGFDEQGADDRLLRVVSSIVQGSLAVGKDRGDHETFASLLHSMLTLLEIAAWTVGEESQSRLMPLIQSERVLLTLLDSNQSSAVISHTVNVLVILATHSSLTRPLLSSHNDNTLNMKQSKTSNPIRVPVIERLSGFLVDPGPLSTSTMDDDASSILGFFSLLIVQNEGRTALLGSSTFIPCLIHYLTRLSSLLWEDDERTMQSPERAKSTVRNVKQALRLLHRLVLDAPSDDPSASDFDFRQKLFYVSHVMFNGLPHMFIVMIGRLSYADPPGWLDAELQTEIEKLTEPARDLMDLVIEGPESDSVWVAYQDSEGDSVTENDDEIEARLLDADNLN